MLHLPIWAQWGQLIATVVVAVFAVCIAYRQWRTAHLRVMLDVFERRMTIYDDARGVIAEIMRDGTATNSTFFHYCQATDRVGLLFGDEVVVYSEMVRERINKLIMHEANIRAHMAGKVAQRYDWHVDESARLLGELTKFYDEFSILVRPYVRMTQKLRPWSFRHRKPASRIDIAGR